MCERFLGFLGFLQTKSTSYIPAPKTHFVRTTSIRKYCTSNFSVKLLQFKIGRLGIENKIRELLWTMNTACAICRRAWTRESKVMAWELSNSLIGTYNKNSEHKGLFIEIKPHSVGQATG